VSIGMPGCVTNARYTCQIRSCCVTGSAASARSIARRVRVTYPCCTSSSMYSSQMRGILCIVARARSNVLFSASRAGWPGGSARVAAVRSVR
jgi:hypothetical protein